MVPVFITSHSLLTTIKFIIRPSVLVVELLPEDFILLSLPVLRTTPELHSYSFLTLFSLFFVLSARSEFALIYNDRSVQESHHLSAAFRLLQDDQMNIFTNLTREEWM